MLILLLMQPAGKPKAIIHGHLGMIFAIKQGGPLHSAIGEKDVHLQISTTGWMMWSVPSMPFSESAPRYKQSHSMQEPYGQPSCVRYYSPSV